MLTWDLVRARATRDRVIVRDLKEAERDVAIETAAAYLERLEAGVGQPRKAVLRALGAVEVPARGRKIADGLRKLLDDRCTWSMADGPEPAVVRDVAFELAARRRRELEPGESFDRDGVLAEIGAELDLPAEDVEGRLFADLKEAWVLREFEPIGPEPLVDAWVMSNRQALLLRATRVVVEVQGARSAAYRPLFRKLKFLRLLHRIERREGGGYRIEIEGPYALFEQVTKYGLQLALMLPVLDTVGPWRLEAEVLWGVKRVRRTLTLQGDGGSKAGRSRLPDELSKLVASFDKLKSGWTVKTADRVLQLPGVGLCVPDLVFRHPEHGAVFLELMGYWSRDAVWKRVELVEKGLKEPIVFAVSSRLRVSEKALDDDLPGALVVFKGVLNAKRVLEAVQGVARAK